MSRIGASKQREREPEEPALERITAIAYRRDADGFYRAATVTIDGDRVVEVDESRPLDRVSAEYDYRVRAGKLFHEVTS